MPPLLGGTGGENKSASIHFQSPGSLQEPFAGIGGEASERAFQALCSFEFQLKCFWSQLDSGCLRTGVITRSYLLAVSFLTLLKLLLRTLNFFIIKPSWGLEFAMGPVGAHGDAVIFDSLSEGCWQKSSQGEESVGGLWIRPVIEFPKNVGCRIKI